MLFLFVLQIPPFSQYWTKVGVNLGQRVLLFGHCFFVCVFFAYDFFSFVSAACFFFFALWLAVFEMYIIGENACFCGGDAVRVGKSRPIFSGDAYIRRSFCRYCAVHVLLRLRDRRLAHAKLVGRHPCSVRDAMGLSCATDRMHHFASAAALSVPRCFHRGLRALLSFTWVLGWKEKEARVWCVVLFCVFSHGGVVYFRHGRFFFSSVFSRGVKSCICVAIVRRLRVCRRRFGWTSMRGR